VNLGTFDQYTIYPCNPLEKFARSAQLSVFWLAGLGLAGLVRVR
jgi:hypothetical protein